ncbi:MAG: prolipoprotein diacylglyceryl transferase [Candidatus Krumholzibacteriota bacterium]|nr:prolipoprotein diacylglyceryl transferase [Candidatus Krumholzibacteriota bacterium]
MHSVLIDWGFIKIYSYGFMLALSFLVGILLAARRAAKTGLAPEVIYDMSIILVLSAVVGSRGLYILTHLSDYHGIIDIIALWNGGATYYGGLILTLIGALIYLKRKEIPFFRVADICSPSIAAGVFLTRIGCFLSGCCFGKPTGCALGVVFPLGSPAAREYFPETPPIHPTQLYSSLYGLIILALLFLLERKKSFDGFTFGFLCVFYGAARFIVDFFRFYEDSAMIGGKLTNNQVISAGVIVGGVLILIWGRRRGRGLPAEV